MSLLPSPLFLTRIPNPGWDHTPKEADLSRFHAVSEAIAALLTPTSACLHRLAILAVRSTGRSTGRQPRSAGSRLEQIQEQVEILSDSAGGASKHSLESAGWSSCSSPAPLLHGYSVILQPSTTAHSHPGFSPKLMQRELHSRLKASLAAAHSRVRAQEAQSWHA